MSGVPDTVASRLDTPHAPEDGRAIASSPPPKFNSVRDVATVSAARGCRTWSRYSGPAPLARASRSRRLPVYEARAPRSCERLQREPRCSTAASPRRSGSTRRASDRRRERGSMPTSASCSSCRRRSARPAGRGARYPKSGERKPVRPPRGQLRRCSPRAADDAATTHDALRPALRRALGGATYAARCSRRGFRGSLVAAGAQSCGTCGGTRALAPGACSRAPWRDPSPTRSARLACGRAPFRRTHRSPAAAWGRGRTPWASARG